MTARRFWPSVIMTVFVVVVLYAIVAALRSRAPRLKAPAETMAGETAVPATPPAAKVFDSLKKDSVRRH